MRDDLSARGIANMMPARTRAFTAPRVAGLVACGLATMLSCAPASATTVTLTQTTVACTSWAQWHEWSLASLRANGGRPSKSCPVIIDKGQKVEVVDDDAGEGAVTVRWRGKVWFVDADRVGE
jgi:hypothetical protein